jgi:hypothetical protein
MRSLRIPAVMGSLGLMVVAGCSSDRPMGASNTGDGTQTGEFTVTAAAVSAAQASTQRISKVFATLQILEAKAGMGTAQAAPTTNSPWDLTYFGGPFVVGATNRPIYVNCATTATTCWGTGSVGPATFLSDLNFSSLIQVENQYIGVDATGRFSGLAELKTTVTFDSSNTASMNDIFAILFAASNFTKASGYNNIYHVFLPAGTDMCMAPGDCYSPDNPATFAFCAFHGSVDFGPHWHVLYTVQPYQFVSGCALPTQTRVIDATASTLSHEFFETVSDPDLDAWFNALTGNEVADLCFGFRPAQQINTRTYAVQEEYSNTLHDCTTGAY